jgi:hypothetical protein
MPQTFGASVIHAGPRRNRAGTPPRRSWTQRFASSSGGNSFDCTSGDKERQRRLQASLAVLLLVAGWSSALGPIRPPEPVHVGVVPSPGSE